MPAEQSHSTADADGPPLRRARVVAPLLILVVAVGVWLMPRDSEVDLRPFVAEYCAGCHNPTDWDGGIAFDLGSREIGVADFNREQHEAAIWEKAVRNVRAGLMPPAGADRPEFAALERFARGIERRLDAAAESRLDPGAEPLSRLNRAEYLNAIRDLLDFDASDVVETLPADEVVAGFDNIGDGLSVSPTLIEAYVAAAMTISRLAVGDRTAGTTQVRYEIPSGLSQDRHIDGLPLGTRGGFVFTHNFPLDGVYEFRVAALRRPGIASQRMCEPPAVSVALNGELLDVGNPNQFRLGIPAGPQSIAVSLLDEVRCAGVNDLHDVYSVGGGIRHVEIHGPYDAAGPGDTPSRRAIFSCRPESSSEELPCARAIMKRLATHAYRRPVSAASRDVDVLLEFYRQGRQAGDFELGIQHAIARLLMSPKFIFQFEEEPDEAGPDGTYRLSDLEIATRLSFFLWSSIPDIRLLETAALTGLTAPVLEAETKRMLADPRAEALVDNFAGQWLSLRELAEALPQDPDFDANLRQALELETKLLVTDVIERDRSVLELLDTDSTYLNERLARHYGIEGVRGSYMRRVELPADSPRRGLLGHGSWLTATSVADRTSPVIRGEWYITHMLGAPVPEPPPGVEADLSDEAQIAREGDTLRERLERHRANPNCASCHRIMDPIGLALENFDLVGRWRETENGKPLVTSVVMIDGTEISGPADLRSALLMRSELFVTALTEKLLTYALGRVVDYRDMPAVRRIVGEAERQDYRFSALVQGIVASEPFQMKVRERVDVAQQ